MNFLLSPERAELASLEFNEALRLINQQNLKKFDPFDKVLLTKGIDNCLLTSFRTLNKKNNLISDTFKIIHNKFAPFRPSGNSYFSSNKKLTEVERTQTLNPPLDLSHLCAREPQAQVDPPPSIAQHHAALPVVRRKEISPRETTEQRSSQTSPPAPSGRHSPKQSPERAPK